MGDMAALATRRPKDKSVSRTLTRLATRAKSAETWDPVPTSCATGASIAKGLSTPALMSTAQRDISDGTLVVRRARDAGAEVVSLCGELDLANAGTAETELREALSKGDKVVIDMRELEFIDSTGIALLVSALGQNGNGAKLSFIPSESPAVTRVLELTGLAERLPLAG